MALLFATLLHDGAVRRDGGHLVLARAAALL
eukprot:COSAG04_NODE_10236_length_794_cov_0.831655_1_plen_30_part_10